MTTRTRFRVEGMDCSSCAAKIETAVGRLPGVSEVGVSLSAAVMTVRHDGGDGRIAAIAQKSAALGFPAAVLADDAATPQTAACACSHSHGHDHLSPQTAESAQTPVGRWLRSPKARQALFSGAIVAAAYALGLIFPAWETEIFTVAVAVCLVPIARRALAAALSGSLFTIEMLMTIAAVGAIIIGAAAEAAAVAVLFLIGEMLEGLAANRARDGIRALAALTPKTARVERDGVIIEAAADGLVVNDIVLARPGDRIPADGVVLSGESGVDESPMTGESAPVAKGPGATVFAGTVNGDGALRIRVAAAAQDNMIARIIRRVEEAQESKAPVQRLINRFARAYTPFVVAVAALTAVVPPSLLGGSWEAWIYKGLAVLLIGCPCALVISTPAAVAAGLAAGARRGLLIKGGDALETLGRADVAAFDKTGTLTKGRPAVVEVVGFALSPTATLRLAAALETGSSHPLAAAVLAHAAAEGLTPPRAENLRTIGGKGISGEVDGQAAFFGSPAATTERAEPTAEQTARIAALQDDGATVAVLTVGGRVGGALALRDQLRGDAAAGLAALRQLGVKAVMLTGDNRHAATAVGERLGGSANIDIHAELSPDDKLRIVHALQAQGRIVAKIGDGINDAPALAAADVGVAMGGGTDVALETADAASLFDRVEDVARMIALSRAVMAIIRQNVAAALGLKAFFLVTTIFGVTGLWPAILADTGATVLVTANALRLLRYDR